jgi:hypothetical protein
MLPLPARDRNALQKVTGPIRRLTARYDTLFFAGEAADTENEAGTVAGALQSGVRAAREQALNPAHVRSWHTLHWSRLQNPAR